MEWRTRMLGFLVLCFLVILVNAIAILTGHGTGVSGEVDRDDGRAYSAMHAYRWLQP